MPAISIFSKFKSFTLILTIITLSFFTIGGCNDSNNGGGDSNPDPDVGASECEVLSDPCTSVSEQPPGDPTHIRCILKDTTCVFNIDNYLTQIQANGFNVDENSILWMGAWGGPGGLANNDGGLGGIAGYAQVTSTVSDLKNTFNETGDIFYFLAESGTNGPNHCGGGGGASTIVTLEDLSLNPSSDPDSSSMLMTAGGGGGGSGGRISGCITPEGINGAPGGVAISGENSDKTDVGVGCQDEAFGCGSTTCGDCVGSMGGAFVAQGGSAITSCSAGSACGGERTCCITNQTEPTNGIQGFGGKGGRGGQGVNCTQTGNAGFTNVTGFSFEAGRGGDAGGGDAACISGGGGGGGGVGGGGSGGHGNESQTAQSGAGGGSFAVESTQTTTTAPTSRPSNACGSGGCLIINIIEN